ncbi:MAG: hypothetical protein AB7S48_10335 [Bacteroidales bacterium]
MIKNILLWILAIIITLSAAVFQRITGPTHPKRTEYQINDSTYKIKLPRSGESISDCPVYISLPDSTTATLYYRKYPTANNFTSIPFTKYQAGEYLASLPKMPAAAKLEYYIEIDNRGKSINLYRNEPIIIRYKDSVPAWALIPHIFIMFFAMMFSNIAGLTAAFYIKSYKTYSFITVILMLIGGFVFGPIVQHFAFGQAWTGFPFGSDLTDNKTLIAFLVWILAAILNRKKERSYATIIAATITIVIFSIPHSLRGSELNYESGKVITGIILNFFQ